MNKTDKIIEILKTLPCYQNGSHYIFDKDINQIAQEIAELDNDWPKEGDKYWTIDFIEEMGVYSYEYDGGEIDISLKKKGLMFRTEEEAREKFKEICEKLNIS